MQTTKKYWLRGGVIFTIIDIIGGLIAWGLFSYSNSLGSWTISNPHLSEMVWTHNASTILGLMFGSPAFVVMFGYMGRTNLNVFNYILPFVVNLGVYFLIGAFLGKLYGKIKNRNRV